MSKKWDLRYLELAKHISTWSKDPSTKIGAVAIAKNGQVLSQGYNGFPRGVADSEVRLADREQKLQRVVHAEMNVIYNASLHGVSLSGSTLYVYGLPCCSDCAKGVIQVGFKRVVMPKQVQTDRWKESWNRAKEMFREGGVKWEFITLE
jgi:dCMP deaminase